MSGKHVLTLTIPRGEDGSIASRYKQIENIPGRNKFTQGSG